MRYVYGTAIFVVVVAIVFAAMITLEKVLG
jgi:hypothetical protein